MSLTTCPLCPFSVSTHLLLMDFFWSTTSKATIHGFQYVRLLPHWRTSTSNWSVRANYTPQQLQIFFSMLTHNLHAIQTQPKRMHFTVVPAVSCCQQWNYIPIQGFMNNNPTRRSFFLFIYEVKRLLWKRYKTDPKNTLTSLPSTLPFWKSKET